MRRLTASVFIPITVVALAACSGDGTTVSAQDGGDTTATTGPAAPGSDSPVLQISAGGGFVPAEYAFGAIPGFTLLADGRVIVVGPTTMEYPGRAVPNVLTGTIDEKAVRDALAAAEKAGVGEDPDLGQPTVADAPTTTFLMVDGGRTSRVDAYALGIDSGPALSARQRENRRRLSDLVERMNKVGGAARAPYRASAVSVLVRPYPAPEPLAPPAEPAPPTESAPPGEPAPGETEWPLADVGTGGRDQFGGRCLGFTGTEAERVLAAGGEARSNTRWRSGGTSWSLVFRPELPGAEPCAER